MQALAEGVDKVFEIPGSQIRIQLSGTTECEGRECTRLPYLISVHNIVDENYRVRHSAFVCGQKLRMLVTESFLKTDARRWKKYPLTCDNPLFMFDKDELSFYDPNGEIISPFLTLPTKVAFSGNELRALFDMQLLARYAFSVIERNTQKQLCSAEVEFGGTYELDNPHVQMVYVTDYTEAKTVGI
jgi:hypothetical protein